MTQLGNEYTKKTTVKIDKAVGSLNDLRAIIAHDLEIWKQWIEENDLDNDKKNNKK